MTLRVIDGPAFRSDAAAKQALRAVIHKNKCDAVSGLDSQGSGNTLREAAHRALCSAGLR